MDRLRHIAVWALLATFIGGAVVGPSLHQLHHALERWSKSACHSSAVHESDVPLWTGAGGHVDTLDCDLCATRLIAAGSSVEPTTTPHQGKTTQVTLRSHLAPVHVVSNRLIRGPPSLPEARLA